MSVTFSELNSRVIAGLPRVDEYCSLPEIHSALVQEVSVLVQKVKLSDTNTELSRTAEFTPTTTKYDITNLIGKGEPAILEMADSNGTFRSIRAVNILSLSEHENSSETVAAFYSEDNNSDLTAASIRYVEFNRIPAGACRIRFDRDGLRVLMASLLELPDYLAELPILRAQNRLIPRMKLHIAQAMTRDEQSKNDLAPVFQILGDVYTQNLANIAELNQMFLIYAFREKGAQSNQPRPIPSSRGIYGSD